jgi:hypothetical protein
MASMFGSSAFGMMSRFGLTFRMYWSRSGESSINRRKVVFVIPRGSMPKPTARFP